MSDLVIQFSQVLGETCIDIDVRVPSRGISAIFGRSGAGKTTLINAVAGLSKPEKGYIAIGDDVLLDTRHQINLPTHKRNVGYVFQDSRLFPHYTVEGNLLYGVKEHSKSQFEHIVELLGLEALLKKKPIHLSGGEKQRVAIGRALLSQPQILLMDEPLASLDQPRKNELMPFLERLVEDIEIPILYVTHSLNEIMRLADHLVIVDKGQVASCGKLEEVWASEAMAPWQSSSQRSSLFNGTMVKEHDKYPLTQFEIAEDVRLWTPCTTFNVGDSARVQIHANDVSIALNKAAATSIRNIISAEISDIVTNNESHEVLIGLTLAPHCRLWASITPWALDELNLSLGMSVYAQVKGVSITQSDIAPNHQSYQSS